MATDIKEKPTLVLIGMEYRKGNEHVTNKIIFDRADELAERLGKNMRRSYLLSSYTVKTETVMYTVMGRNGNPPDARIIGRVMRTVLENSDGAIN